MWGGYVANAVVELLNRGSRDLVRGPMPVAPQHM
jgi:hypothetical protein